METRLKLTKGSSEAPVDTT
jgi:hypothetical protein